MKLSGIVNTHNEERNIVRCLRSLYPHVDEIVVVDMHSTDETVKLAKNYTKKIYTFEPVGYVEPARNFAISKTTGDWIVILDADEVIGDELGVKLRRLAEHGEYDYYRLPRKNLIFGKWLTHSGWWPDYQIRFFKKECVTWGNDIHSVPTTVGRGMDLPMAEKNALIHYHYETIAQYLERLNRYTTQEALELANRNEEFKWTNLLRQPLSEFLRRYYAWEGYKDGVHGLALSLLQAVSFLVVQLKLWEQTHFSQTEISEKEFGQEIRAGGKEFHYWSQAQKGKEGEKPTLLRQLRGKIRL